MTHTARLLTATLIATLGLTLACDPKPKEDPKPADQPASQDKGAEAKTEKKPLEAPPSKADAPEKKDAAPTTPPPAGMKKIDAGEWAIYHSATEAWMQRGEEKIALYSEARGKKECKEGMTEFSNPDELDYSEKGRVISVTSTHVSVEVLVAGYCGGAHPFVFQNYQTYALGGDKLVTLSSLFDAAEYDKAIAADSFAKKVQAAEGIGDDCALSYYIPDAGTTGFAFHHTKDGKVAVRVGLSHAVEACRGIDFKQLGMYLTPKNADLTKALEAADKAGTLMKTLAASPM